MKRITNLKIIVRKHGNELKKEYTKKYIYFYNYEYLLYLVIVILHIIYNL